MNRPERKLKDSIIIATAISIVAFIGYFISEMVGFDKMNPAKSPKTFYEIIDEWPRLIGFSAFVFVAVWWWQMSQKEPDIVICCNCKEVHEKEKVSDSICQRCGGRLEELEGYYDRHPEQR
ncbi:hypothetical protein KI811_08235 [Geobacter hydrogenophilus]|uniref:Uncharacterized protein n=1 Tax=Geobacter hydrogenophilus TaxID=40983 RepID=A0A9W6FZ74_9BACT|nr:hypothetical protein [Geobacter hydrogenophilus]MBT0893799.1 hypothetical protein [Geobacter hydrogenophilus]GLI37502.1 hypothetical protein GHYDROH2_10030 [Geobacter hydrogenophilus]